MIETDENGLVKLESLPDGALAALRDAAAGHGNTKAFEAYQRLLDERASPDLFRHSRRRR